MKRLKVTTTTYYFVPEEAEGEVLHAIERLEDPDEAVAAGAQAALDELLTEFSDVDGMEEKTEYELIS